MVSMMTQTAAKRLLIIDDEPDIRNILSAVAQKIGFDVVTVEDKDGFEQQLQSWSPSHVILDIVMPNTDGITLLDSLDKVDFKGSVIGISGHSPIFLDSFAQLARGKGLKHVSTLAKPISIADVATLLTGDASIPSEGTGSSNTPQKRLLITDDEPDIAEFISEVAQSVGYEIAHSVTRSDFQKQLKDWQPSLVILDLNMPGSDGIELMRDIASLENRPDIIIMSGVATRVLESAERIARERGLSVIEALSKPVRLAQLQATLERAMIADQPLSASELSAAIANDQIIVYYQPKIDLRTSAICSLEALARWQHPVRGLIPPDRFIGLAEANGLIDDLTYAILRSSLRQYHIWKMDELALPYSVNLSAATLTTMDFPDKAASICAEYEVPCDQVTFEVTESASMADPIAALDILTRLRLKGFQLSIDDFGTGFSSIVHLQRLPLSEIKIDKSFCMHLLDSSDSAVIVETILAMANGLALSAVAEGVESRAVMDRLTTLGCDYAQGYHISPPLPPEQIAKFISRWRSAA